MPHQLQGTIAVVISTAMYFNGSDKLAKLLVVLVDHDID